MIISYAECLERYNNKYNLAKQVSEGNLYKLEKGIYCDKEYVPERLIIAAKYPKAVFTSESAFFYLGLTDSIPIKYFLMTDKNSAKISDKRVVQIFENSDILYLGAENIEFGGSTLLMYNKERMLLELLRNKNKLPFDYYKEIVNNYRKIIDTIDIRAVQDMLKKMPKAGMIGELLKLEVL